MGTLEILYYYYYWPLFVYKSVVFLVPVFPANACSSCSRWRSLVCWFSAAATGTVSHQYHSGQWGHLSVSGHHGVSVPLLPVGLLEWEGGVLTVTCEGTCLSLGIMEWMCHSYLCVYWNGEGGLLTMTCEGTGLSLGIVEWVCHSCLWVYRNG